jgi:hypothetical protein
MGVSLFLSPEGEVRVIIEIIRAESALVLSCKKNDANS